MAEFDLVIKGGTVATAADTVPCDIGIRGGKVVALGDSLKGGKETIDATGKLVMPGGIDSHCHIAQIGSMGVETADDFESGTRSAACGGTTTIIPFAAQYRGQSLRTVVDAYRKKADGKALCDYAIHLIISDPTEQVLGQELPGLIRDGYTSFKVYMTYDALKLDDRQMLDVLACAKREGAMVMVHAENHDVIKWITERLLNAGKIAPKYHGFAHAAPAEREATHRIITLSQIVDVPILIVHVSGREAIEQIRWAQSRGLRVMAETCPQYLYLSQEDLEKAGWDGAMCQCSPPPRGKENQQFVWLGIEDGTFQTIGSDHAPYRYDETGKLKNGKNPPFTKIPNGLPGLEARMPLVYQGGVAEKRITVNRFVSLMCTEPAKIYGLYPRKGTIAVGSDADIAIWDTNRNVTISQKMLHDNMNYTPYEGIKVSAWPITTLSRGRIVWNDGKVLGKPGDGQFIPCELPEPAKPRARPAGFDLDFARF